MMYDKIKISKPNFHMYGVQCTIIAKIKFKMKTTLFQWALHCHSNNETECESDFVSSFSN